MKSTAVLLLAGLVLCGRSSLPGQDCKRFRGVNGTGLYADAPIPAAFSEKDFVWSVPLPGPGHAQPIILGERVFVTASTDDGRQRMILCLRDRDGAVDWSRIYSMATHGKHRFNSYASSTPTVDGAHVYFALGAPEGLILRAVTHDGKEVWKRDLGPFLGKHGNGSSPILFGDMVVLAKDQEGESFLIAVDRLTGKTRWQTPRRVAKTAYGTPCVHGSGAAAQLLFTSQSHGISGVDPRTGKMLWEAPVFDKRMCASPVIADDLVIGTCGSGGGGNYLVALRLGGKGDVSTTHVAYRLDRSIPYVPTSIFKDGRLYLWGDNGVVSCYRARDGEPIWRERVGGSDRYFSSPVCVGDRIYGISGAGEVVTIAASDEFRVLGRSQVPGKCHSTPAVARGKLYVRTFTHLVAIGGKKALD